MAKSVTRNSSKILSGHKLVELLGWPTPQRSVFDTQRRTIIFRVDTHKGECSFVLAVGRLVWIAVCFPKCRVHTQTRVLPVSQQGKIDQNTLFAAMPMFHYSWYSTPGMLKILCKHFPEIKIPRSLPCISDKGGIPDYLVHLKSSIERLINIENDIKLPAKLSSGAVGKIRR